MSLTPVQPFPKPSASSGKGTSTGNTARALDAIDCFLDPLDPECAGGIIFGGGGSGGGGSTNVTVNVPPPVITVNVPTEGITNAVNKAIDASNQVAAQGLTDVSAEIGDALNGVNAATNSFLQQSQNILLNGIAGAVTSLLDPQTVILAQLESSIGELGPQIASTEAQIVNPLLVAVADLGSVFDRNLQSIGSGIDQGIASLGAALGFLSTGLDGNLNNIAHWLEIMAVWLPNHTTTTIDWGNIGSISVDLKRMADILAGISVFVGNPTAVPHDVLGMQCNLLGTFNQLKSWLDAQDHLRYPFNELWEWAKGLIANIALLIPEIGKYLENAQQVIDRSCPLGLLDPSLVAELHRRKIIDEQTANAELASQGISPSRAKAIFDREIYQSNSNELLEWFYRGAIDGNSVQEGLTSLGYNQAQIAATQAAGAALLDTQTILTAWRRNVITESEVDTALRVHRFADAQIQLIKTLSYRRPTPAEWLNSNARSATLGQVSLPFLTGFFDIPQWYVDSGRDNGWDSDTIRTEWTNHWNILGVDAWVQSYFRGLRNAQELSTALDSFLVPKTIQPDIVEISRPLIPFRTVPAMLKAGVITIDTARSILHKHGFSEPDTETLIAYSEIKGGKAGATAASATHQISLAVAKEAYTDGVISQAQYMDLLAAHGLTSQATDIEVKLTDFQDQLKARKQTATDIVNEFKAGLIDEPTAEQQLATTGLTVAEQAKYSRQLIAARSAKSKVPSEAELRAMAVAEVITVDAYQAALVTTGYSQTWAQAFRDLHFPASPRPTGGTTTMP